MNPLNKILDYKISYQENAWAELSKEITIGRSLDFIKAGIYKSRIEGLRNHLKSEDFEAYNKHKVTLPAITFCGTFDKKRRKEQLKNYNSIIVIDIDKLESEKLNQVCYLLDKDPLVFSFWKSPSNRGVKGLISINYNFEFSNDSIDFIHKNAFNKLAIYFENEHGIVLDKSGSDTTRLCFFSYDKDLVLKDSFKPFEVFESDLLIKKSNKKALKTTITGDMDALYNPLNRNNQRDRKTISSIIKFLEKKNFTITDSYEKWYSVAMSIANSFTYDIGLKYFIRFSALDSSKFNELNCINFLQNCYKTRNGSINFNSIIHLANEKNYFTKQQIKKDSETA